MRMAMENSGIELTTDYKNQTFARGIQPQE
jgi:hypothetical protein